MVYRALHFVICSAWNLSTDPEFLTSCCLRLLCALEGYFLSHSSKGQPLRYFPVKRFCHLL
jgi:hypothetical protein